MGRHVLVVEDEPLIRMDAVEMLETAGLSVLEFDNADEALAYTQSHPSAVAAVFTDINLRGSMDGIRLASEVVRTDATIAVLVTSGRYDKRPQALPDGVRFLKKPWMPLDVITAMQLAVAA